jgi:type II secretory pathway component PulC
VKKNRTKSLITLLNVSLLFLIAFIGFQTVEKVLGAHMDTVSAEPLSAKDNTPAKNTLFSSNRSISEYRAVWERNLFNTSQKTLSSPQKQIDLANVTEADNNIGLKLVGTMGGHILDQSFKSAIRFAIIEHNKSQNIYYEGDTAGSYVIKKILRNNVIIVTDNGDRLLALESNHAGRGKVLLASSSQVAPKASRHNRSGGRFRTVELPREEIMTAFDDIDRLIREVGTSSYKLGKLTGFKIDSVPEKSILKKIGLRSHDKILALNEKPIDGENGAFEFFEQIAEGKKVTIKYRRRNRTRRIELNPI